MKLHVYLLSALALLGCPSLALAQQSGSETNTITGRPWIANRAIGEGAGVRTGNFEWHPGVAAEVGLDTNYLQRASSSEEAAQFGPPVSSLHLRVTPSLSLRNVNRAAESGGDERVVGAPPVQFNLQGFASYNEFIALKKGYGSDFSKLRNLEGGGGLGLNFFSDRTWSGQLDGGYTYMAEPSNQGGFGAQFNRHNVVGGAKLIFKPGGGAFRWDLLGYRTMLTFFDNAAVFNSYDRQMHTFTTAGSWKFLPKTAILYDGKFDIIRYSGNSGLNDGEALTARMGLNGLLTKKLSLLAMAGWATSMYKNQNGVARNYNSVVGKAEAKWFFTADGKLLDGYADVGASALALGFVRDYNDSYLGDFYMRNRGYVQGSYLIGGRVITTLAAGVSRINYPDFFSDAGVQQGFGETRIDVNSFTEFRPAKQWGINLQLRYDQNISQTRSFAAFTDDFSFNRFRAIVGARWFL